MSDLDIRTSPEFEAKLASYPDFVRDKLVYLRRLIIETAREIPEVETLEETLKWGEPSFLSPKGSTLRFDWKRKTPHQYQIYFKCTSKLVPTFREVFGNTFRYEKNRAIIFQLDEELPISELKRCIKATLTYHIQSSDGRLNL